MRRVKNFVIFFSDGCREFTVTSDASSFLLNIIFDFPKKNYLLVTSTGVFRERGGGKDGIASPPPNSGF